MIERDQDMFRPSGRGSERLSVQSVAIGDGQRQGMASTPMAAVIKDCVDLDETGHSVVPLGPGAHRDLTFEQRPRLAPGVGARSPAGSSGIECDAQRLEGILTDTH